MVTVSMNLVDTDVTPVYRAFELVKVEASRYGLTCHGHGDRRARAPGRHVRHAAHYLQLRGFDADDQILENLIGQAERRLRDGARP